MTKGETVSVLLATPRTDFAIGATSSPMCPRRPVCEQRLSTLSSIAFTSPDSAPSRLVCAFIIAFCSLIASTSAACFSLNCISTQPRRTFNVSVLSLTHASVVRPDKSLERRSPSLPTFAETTVSTCALTSCTTLSNMRNWFLRFRLNCSKNTDLTESAGWLSIVTRQGQPRVPCSLDQDSLKQFESCFGVLNQTSNDTFVPASTGESCNIEKQHSEVLSPKRRSRR